VVVGDVPGERRQAAGPRQGLAPQRHRSAQAILPSEGTGKQRARQEHMV